MTNFPRLLCCMRPLQMLFTSKPLLHTVNFQDVISTLLMASHFWIFLKIASINIFAALRLSHCHMGRHAFLLYTHFVFFTKLCEDNHMLVAPSVWKWLPTPDGTGHSDKSSHKQSYALSSHASSQLEINMIPLLSTHRSLCYALAGLVHQHPNGYSQSLICSGNETNSASSSRPPGPM